MKSLGRWWGNDPRKKAQTEIDIMREQDGNSAVFAECKWRNEGALFPVFKDRIYKGMYGKGRGNVTLVMYADIVINHLQNPQYVLE